MHRWFIALVAGAAVPGAGCVVDLDHVIACGDGYVDELAGEECDPHVPESFADGCFPTRPLGRAACDPDSCEIIATELQCAHCGDGVIDAAAGEECDGSTIGAACPAGGQPTCTLDCKISLASCEPCGNGLPDVDEECDWANTGGIAAARLCGGDDPLEPYWPDKPFTSGTTVSCTKRCEFDRRTCGYCGNGELDGATQVSEDGTMSRPEVCDGEDFEPTALAAAYPSCDVMEAPAHLVCASDCLSFAEMNGACP